MKQKIYKSCKKSSICIISNQNIVMVVLFLTALKHVKFLPDRFILECSFARFDFLSKRTLYTGEARGQ